MHFARYQLLTSAMCMFACGCMANLRHPLAPDEAQQFRGSALRYIKEAAASDEPVLRMQALEAFQEVAPTEGAPYIADNIDNGYAGVSFAALMAAGTLRQKACLEKVKLRAEDVDPSVRIAALYALHRFGDQRRTGELGDYLVNHADARVRANAALAIGRLGEKGSVKLLRSASVREKKDAVKMQIREALAMLEDHRAAEELIFSGYSAVPDQATLALMLLANSRCARAEELFRSRLHQSGQPETKLQAARGLGLLGIDEGLDLACRYLYFNSPMRGLRNDPPEQQIARVRALAALALEAIGDPNTLGSLRDSFFVEGQAPGVRLATARAAVGITNKDAAQRIGKQLINSNE